uniref:CSON005106 protein n=1 Tax=Culicoides sonorensis TaxID=179676 RepID=A0A336MR40_CULSO
MDLISKFNLLDQEYFSPELEDFISIENEFNEREKNKKSKRRYINRDFAKYEKILHDDYFSESPIFPDDVFERRFRMNREMFQNIANAMEDDYFKVKFNCTGKRGLSSIQKCTVALRLLAYGNAADSIDEYVKVGESTALEILRKFCSGMISVYGSWFLRSPNSNDIKNLFAENSRRGFPGMLGSIDCMHWSWRNCPVAYQGQYQGKESKPTVVLEAIASHNLHIWHCFFGLPGSLNDINILDRSPIVDDVLHNKIPKIKYSINGTQRETGYWLADGIYPDWPIFVKTISEPSNRKAALFSKKQESLRKDVERAFGVLQSQWHILKNPGRLWDVSSMSLVMKTCIILHNMRIEYANESKTTNQDRFYENHENSNPNQEYGEPPDDSMAGYLRARQNMKSRNEYALLREDLINHLWNLEGNSD